MVRESAVEMDFKSRREGKRVRRVGSQGSESDNVHVNSYGKRKRVFADRFPDSEFINKVKTKDSYKKGRKKINDDSIKVRSSNESIKVRNSKGQPRSIWVSDRMKAGSSRKKHPSPRITDETEVPKLSSGKRRTKDADKLDSDRNRLFKNFSKSKSDSRKYPSPRITDESELPKFSSGKRRTKEADKFDSDKNSLFKKLSKSKSDSRKHPHVPLSRFAKKIARNKNSLVDGDLEIDDKPKKKKRVIRLDPHDTSNKRLDEGEVTNESTKEKEKEFEVEAGMSKNAQFRAIKPSPSILSFVEDNLLGRRRLIELKRAGYNIELSAPLDNIPLSTSSERERIEENIFRNKMNFFAAAKVSSSFPPPDLPEIAFAGRSNVGKSSLLNSLTRQWGVARTSDKPGLTQTINFFSLGSKLCLVDLPGYGFAYAKEEVKDAWEDLVKEYVSTRAGLKRVCLLIDTKWGMKPRDHELIDLMERSQTKYQIVLTKTDVVFPIDVARRAVQIEESLKANKSIVQPVMMVSSKSGAGIRSLRTVLSKIARFAKL